MSLPTVAAVAPGSAAERAGLVVGDVVLTINGTVPRDIIEWRFAADDAEVALEVQRGGLELTLEIEKRVGEPLGAEVSSAVFDRVRTCDNHCEFCFIYQLPKGLRKSLYLKDDDYRLSFLYGNFTTLTRFTEADLERVITERLSPLNVSIHATDPEVRSRMLKNPRGGMSLRWLRALLDHGITVRGQVVLCPGVNDGAVFEQTMVGILDQYPELESVAVVPLGLSKFNAEAAMRLHTQEEANAMVAAVHEWQQVFLRVLHDALFSGPGASDLLIPRRPLAELLHGFFHHQLVALHDVARHVHVAGVGGVGDDEPAVPFGVLGRPADGVVVVAGGAHDLGAVGGNRRAAALPHRLVDIDDAAAAEGAGTPGDRAAVVAVGGAGHGGGADDADMGAGEQVT